MIGYEAEPSHLCFHAVHFVEGERRTDWPRGGAMIDLGQRPPPIYNVGRRICGYSAVSLKMGGGRIVTKKKYEALPF